MQIKEIISNKLKNVLDLEENEIYDLLEVPSDKAMADIALPCFKLAKVLKTSPIIIAENLKEKLTTDELITSIEAVSGYLNFKIGIEYYLNEVKEDIEKYKEEYGASDIGNGKTIVIDYSSTNIAKPFHIGHIRSTLIGDSLKRIARRLGYKTIGVNHLGDYGTQFGMLISAYKKWGNKEEIEKNPIDELLKLYVKFNSLQEENPKLREEAHYWFKELENSNPEAIEIWQWMKDLSLKEFNRVYKILEIEFDSYNGEAFYQDKMDRVVKLLEDKNLIEESEGCKIVNLGEDMPPVIIKKSNDTTTYATRDIAAAIYRKETYDFEENIYVVATEQNLHFKQLFKLLEMMGFEWAKKCKHVAFGMVSVQDGALSTRKGKVLYLEDVLNKAINKTLEIITERNPELENKEQIAKDIGIGAIKFQELYNQRIKDYVFNWDKALSFEGETGPYVQYTFARCNSLIKKSNTTPEISNIKQELIIESEKDLIKEIYDLKDTIKYAFEKYEPFYITRKITEIAKLYNRYYYENQIITEDIEQTKHRVAISYIVKTVIKSALKLLGINTPERM